ncbi:hypothetical protein ACFO1B_00955 [Dactylosporangium siamense]|uniref:Uncharacterized protein n=1 Tax=Dactylosporangium siamense TaxID=685454 RepID=A0A919PGC4_9ACTN|nr:hypothetical protein [Dactylosporangium siamense]GIG42080.1 hypothetical protein Dsi01nite_001210 [Dactylosporangium siamense]
MSKVVKFVGSLVVLAILAGVGWYLNRDAALNAKSGDCVHQVSANELKIVKCDASDADFKVVGKVDNKPESEAMGANSTVCNAFEATTNVYWEGKPGKNGDVLCLQSLKA